MFKDFSVKKYLISSEKIILEHIVKKQLEQKSENDTKL